LIEQGNLMKTRTLLLATATGASMIVGGLVVSAPATTAPVAATLRARLDSATRVAKIANGYWLVTSSGAVSTFGAAKFYGSMSGKHLNEPIVGIVASPDGHGYWLVAKDGGVFSFGDATFEGSLGNKYIASPVVGMASSSGNGAATTGLQGPRGPVGPKGARGATGATGGRGATGPAGPAGATGSQGARGPIGMQGPAGPVGATGATGARGPAGATGAKGASGTTGATGSQGIPGTSGIIAEAEFFALMPPDNAATVAPGTAVQFPQNGPTVGSSITRTGTSTFQLSAIATYNVSFVVSVTEAGQLGLSLNGAELPYTVNGRATGTSQIVGQALVTTTALNEILRVENPAGESTALTITPLAGGTDPVSATLVIQQAG
jgi:hypothetical protein